MNHNDSILIVTYRFFLAITAACMIAFLSACETTGPRSQVQEPDEVSLQQNQRILTLLGKAEQAFEDKRLTTPVENNAYLRYLQVLSIDPDNSVADQGIANIVEKYLAWSMDAVYSGRYRKATDYLNKAKSVDEKHPSIASVENLINNHTKGGRKTFVLSRIEIEARTPETVTALETIAAEIASFDARIVIEAPSDPTARWIYQQLNNATAERVSARFEMTSRVRIHLFY